MAAALATSKSSSSSRRAARMPKPLPSPALPSPGASVPQPAPLPAYATGRIATERHIPVYTPQPGDTESLEHAIDAKPAYQPDLDARRQVEEERRQYLAALARRRFDEEIAAAWAAAPIVLWGGMTLAGCVLRLAFGAATVVLVVTAIGAALPFVRGRRYLPLGVACGVLVALAGTWILEGIGGILVANAWRALDRSGTALDLQQVESRVNDWLCFSALMALWLVSLISVVRGLRFEFVWWRDCRHDAVAARQSTPWRKRARRLAQRLRAWLGWKSR